MKMLGRSALAAAVDERAEWSRESCLLVEILDRLEIANWLSIEINSENNDIAFPTPWPRPGDKRLEHIEEEKEQEFASLEEVAQLFSMSTPAV